MKRSVLFLTILFVSTSAFANSFDFLKLKVAKDIKPGLWSTTFTITPPNPHIKNRVEEVCATQAQLVESLNEVTTQEERPCKIETKSDLTTEAKLLMRCPPMKIPQLGVAVPGSDIPMTITKNSMVQWTVMLDMPAVPGAAPKSIWKHVYKRLKDCP